MWLLCLPEGLVTPLPVPSLAWQSHEGQVGAAHEGQVGSPSQTIYSRLLPLLGPRWGGKKGDGILWVTFF